MGRRCYYESEWIKTRDRKWRDVKLHAFETVMSLTGTNADARTMVKPSEQQGVGCTAQCHCVAARP